jgi:V8-like Glu-specific endopeptidase
MRLGGPGAFLFVVAMAHGCAAEDTVRASTAAVVNGIPVDDMDATVRLTNVWGGLCSGSLVAPQVVMTAKHCLDSGTLGWGIGIGPTGSDRYFDIDDVYLTEDMGGDTYQNEDIAFAILEEPVLDVEPYPIPWDGDDLHGGDDVTLLGYGGTEDGTAGRKYETIDRVIGVGDFEFVTSGNGVCGGDSGGTALDENGFVVGVIVRGPVGDCGPIVGGRTTALTRVTTWLDIAKQAFDRTGACYPTAEEVCDGDDDDCDGIVDEGCAPVGAPCAAGDDCATGTCEVVLEERVCTDACDPARPADGCGAGAHCLETSCGVGWCAAGEAGEGALGDSCDDATDCASLVCALGVCGELCSVGRGECAPGDVCRSDGGCATGGCVDAALDPTGPRALGEPCLRDGDCISGDCLATEVGRYCTERCGECPASWHCEDRVCRRGGPGEPGDPCRTSEECLSSECAHWADGASCTVPCEGGDCPEGLSCTDQGLCEPDTAPTGGRCRENGDCFRGLCGHFAQGDFCTQICDESAACPAGFACVQSANDVRICARPSVTAEGGCRAAPGRGGGLAWGFLFLALARRPWRR